MNAIVTSQLHDAKKKATEQVLPVVLDFPSRVTMIAIPAISKMWVVHVETRTVPNVSTLTEPNRSPRALSS